MCIWFLGKRWTSTFFRIWYFKQAYWTIRVAVGSSYYQTRLSSARRIQIIFPRLFNKLWWEENGEYWKEEPGVSNFLLQWRISSTCRLLRLYFQAKYFIFTSWSAFLQDLKKIMLKILIRENLMANWTHSMYKTLKHAHRGAVHFTLKCVCIYYIFGRLINLQIVWSKLENPEGSTNRYYPFRLYKQILFYKS